MLRTLPVLAGLFLLLPAASAQTLDSLIDRNRVLLVFAPTDHDPLLQQQLKVFDHHAQDLNDRDLLIIPVLSQAGPPTTANTLRILHPPLISDREQLTLRHRFRVAPADFAAILLGKDGGEKLRSTTPIAVERLNEVIDSMPMRQQEIRDRKKK